MPDAPSATEQPSPPPTKLSFEEVYPELEQIVGRRKHSWAYTSIMEWADVRAILIEHLWTQYPTYDPTKGKLENWANFLVSNRIQNLNRDEGGRRLQRPCVGGGKTNGKSCTYNLGGDHCSFTPSKRQCAECPVYAEWQRTRQAQFHVKAQVSLENHTQEVHSKPDDSIDTERVRDWLHAAMLKELSRWEGRVYRLSIMAEIPPAKVADILAREVAKRKRPPAPHERYNYAAVLEMNREFRGMMRVLLLRAGHIGEEHMDPDRNRHRLLSHG